MRHRLEFAVSVFLWGLLLPCVRAQKPGDVLPRVELRDWKATKATSYADFVGRVVLFFFFAPDDEESQDWIIKLNDLKRRFSTKGLSIIAVVSDEKDPEETAAWVKRHGLIFQQAVDPFGSLARNLNSERTPRVVLASPSRKILFSDEPDELKTEFIEKQLVAVWEKPIFDWPESSKKLKKKVMSGHYRSALLAAKAMEASGEVSGAVYVTAIENLFRFEVEAARACLEAGDYLSAKLRFKLLVRESKGRPELKELKNELRKVTLDKVARPIIVIQTRIAKLREKTAKIKKKKDAQKIMDELVKIIDAHPDDYAGKQANRLAESLQYITRNLDR